MSGALHRSARRASALAAICLLASGCAAVRPVALRPPIATPAAYVSDLRADEPSAAPPAEPRVAGSAESRAKEAPTVAVTDASAGDSSPPDRPAPRSVWWAAFADPALDDAIQEALRNNYTIRDLRHLIYENELDPAMPRGFSWPLQVGLPGTVQHATTPSPIALGETGSNVSYQEADVGLEASYQVDVFGKLDTQRRLFEDLIEQQRQSTQVSAQTLAEQVAQLWFQILEQRALKKLLESQVEYSQELLGIVRARFEQHLVPRLVVLQQEQQLLALQAQVPLTVAQLALLSSRLTALLGRMPSPNADLVPSDRRLPDLPPAPPVGAPADLLRDSPELHFAQARVAEAEHLVSQNLANWLPTIELFGNVGVQTYDFSERYVTSATGIRMTWAIFDGGQRIRRAKQLELTVQRRNWQYEAALKSAVQRVQDALIQEQKQADNLRALRAQAELGRRVLVEARQLFEQGLSDYLPVVTALATSSNLERASIQAQRLLLSYRVQLYHALGGAWSEAATKVPN